MGCGWGKSEKRFENSSQEQRSRKRKHNRHLDFFFEIHLEDGFLEAEIRFRILRLIAKF